MNQPPINLLLAIPTYNRLEKLKILLKSFEAQLADDSFTCTLAISNSESTDGTFEFIEKLEPFDPIRKVIKYNKRANPDEPRPNNWNNLFQIIPPDGGWVWLMGDDDYLVSPSCLRGLAAIIKAHDRGKLALIHPTQARRSKGSKKAIQLNLVDAANTFGFLELLGWMSSIVIRSDLIPSTFLEGFFDTKDEPALVYESSGNAILDARSSAFRHSAQIMKTCVNEKILVIDDYFAEPQDEEQTQASISRWREESIGLRYMFVVDDVEYLVKKDIINTNITATFFRYHNQFLWDRFSQYIVAHLLQAGELDDYCLAFMQRLARVEILLGEPSEIHLFRLWRTCFFNAIEESLKSRQRYLESSNKLEQLVQLSFKGVYSFDTFQ